MGFEQLCETETVRGVCIFYIIMLLFFSAYLQSLFDMI